jgi:hypothetical protein
MAERRTPPQILISNKVESESAQLRERRAGRAGAHKPRRHGSASGEDCRPERRKMTAGVGQISRSGGERWFHGSGPNLPRSSARLENISAGCRVNSGGNRRREIPRWYRPQVRFSTRCFGRCRESLLPISADWTASKRRSSDSIGILDNVQPWIL